MINRYSKKSLERKTKIRAKLKKLSSRLRLSVFRSNKSLFCQIIDDKKRITLVSASYKDLKEVKKGEFEDLKAGGEKIGEAYILGQILAGRALKKKIKLVYFDRGSYKYHGRVKAVALGARKGGLKF
ncbi:50S ribosomal protein L18 [Candidatus Beckwithbacteria bacterium CG10_big_fil_rev_8_21_14_0_10_34_10]|uniref:Large ribosomal subunit protein uL18 n=1 Tax=Candidatus Beckwithbacteria bacterium CG10_big_fil_rev_8_21_14_0_10_34_10 TaxID=1974495 RepID=A0A2H0W7T4_9BACT|nr:MAG: 50S ribosomal protein L18 [Candidatus Beckwithbacteria bacterium CG10_big_fil_rev_8_21_14_0_10_34_10]